MSGWLLDTHVLAELRRPQPEPKVTEFINGEPLERLHVSAVTLADIRFGIELISDPSQRSEIGLWLDHKLRPLFEQRILAVTEDILHKWRIIIEEGRKAGHTYSHPDVLIAATAAHHALTVVTRDMSEFIAAGVNVLNPWTGEVHEP